MSDPVPEPVSRLSRCPAPPKAQPRDAQTPACCRAVDDPDRAGRLAGCRHRPTRDVAGGRPDRVHGRRVRLHVRDQKTKNSAAGVPILLAFTFFMGLMLSRLVAARCWACPGAGLIMMAFTGTGLIFFGMATLSSVIKRDPSSMGKFLFIGMIMLLGAGIANIFLQSSALDDHAVGADDRHLLGLHPLRPQAHPENGEETNPSPPRWAST